MQYETKTHCRSSMNLYCFKYIYHFSGLTYVFNSRIQVYCYKQYDLRADKKHNMLWGKCIFQSCYLNNLFSLSKISIRSLNSPTVFKYKIDTRNKGNVEVWKYKTGNSIFSISSVLTYYVFLPIDHTFFYFDIMTAIYILVLEGFLVDSSNNCVAVMRFLHGFVVNQHFIGIQCDLDLSIFRFQQSVDTTEKVYPI